jgi:hypothetical protein
MSSTLPALAPLGVLFANLWSSVSSKRSWTVAQCKRWLLMLAVVNQALELLIKFYWVLQHSVHLIFLLLIVYVAYRVWTTQSPSVRPPPALPHKRPVGPHVDELIDNYESATIKDSN